MQFWKDNTWESLSAFQENPCLGLIFKKFFGAYIEIRDTPTLNNIKDDNSQKLLAEWNREKSWIYPQKILIWDKCCLV